jgi:uncharacterized protein
MSRAEPDLPAGEFSRWLRRMRAVLAGEGDADVPCGECSACCASAHFVHVGADEHAALAAIPRELLFPAPGQPRGTMLLGYDEHGRCPLLGENGLCTVYAHRPLTCRTYDCRVFAAAATAADCEPVTRQARRWRFAYPTQADRDRHAAVRAAAAFAGEEAGRPPGAGGPRDPVRVALLALKVYEVFLEQRDAAGTGEGAPAERGLAEAVIAASEEFEATRAAACGELAASPTAPSVDRPGRRT